MQNCDSEELNFDHKTQEGLKAVLPGSNNCC